MAITQICLGWVAQAFLMCFIFENILFIWKHYWGLLLFLGLGYKVRWDWLMGYSETVYSLYSTVLWSVISHLFVSFTSEKSLTDTKYTFPNRLRLKESGTLLIFSKLSQTCLSLKFFALTTCYVDLGLPKSSCRVPTDSYNDNGINIHGFVLHRNDPIKWAAWGNGIAMYLRKSLASSALVCSSCIY